MQLGEPVKNAVQFVICMVNAAVLLRWTNGDNVRTHLLQFFTWFG
jgi:hypothetical protein